MKRTLGIVVASSLIVLAAGAAQAQSTPATCEPQGGGTLNVVVNGQATTIESTLSGILVNGAFCGWPDEVGLIQVVGGALVDRVTLRGSFIPGAEAETDWDELEVTVNLGGGTDTVTLELHFNDDVVFANGAGVNVNGDVDSDFNLTNVEVFNLMGMGGNDQLLAGGSALPSLHLYGGDGNDVIQGSGTGNDILEGDAGDDLLQGFGGDDTLIGGPGSDEMVGDEGVDTVDYRARTAPVTVTIGNGAFDDGEAGEQDHVRADVEVVLGGTGADVLVGSPLADTLNGGGGADLLDGGLGPDVLIGGPGVDTVDYSSRTAAVNVSTGGPGTSTDGEAGELDFVDPTVENVTGGAGNDTIIGHGAKNTLRGGLGNDNLDGQDGDDRLYGDAGDDSLLGGSGADKLYGAGGSDVLDGGADADTFTAGGGNDFLFNDDGVAETVNCGAGNADDAEVDTGAVDTFIGCEL